MKKVLIFGQATGGNAALWFEYLNKIKSDIPDLKVTFLSRTRTTLKGKFPVFSPYGKGDVWSIFLSKVRSKLASLILIDMYLKFLGLFTKYDLVVLQGNYTPKTNLKVLSNCNGAASVVNIYGSDFYRKYKLNEFSLIESQMFIEVLDRVDCIMINWKGVADDFIAEFPQYKSKIKINPWGVNSRWKSLGKAKSEAANITTFISTRALHDYNNVDLVVEAFIKSFGNDSKYQLRLLAAYGIDDKVFNRIQKLAVKHSNILIEVDKWYDGDDLVQVYEQADYNICFGSTDQLSLSIVYGLLSNTVNILSPLKNYYYLHQLGFKTPVICDEISSSSLSQVFTSIVSNDSESTKFELDGDREMAIEMFNLDRTFQQYLDLANRST
jgi:hypothetical protein